MNSRDLRELRGHRRLIVMAMRRLQSYPQPSLCQVRALNDCRHALAVVDSRLEEAQTATLVAVEEPSHVGSR